MSKEYSNHFVKFLNNSPTQYHVVRELKAMLLDSGFIELKEKEMWSDKLEKGKSYFLTRGDASIVAFSVGGEYDPKNGFSIVCAHTDSPGLRIKPVSKKESQGSVQIAVSTYGGGMWFTWFDRDLTLAGKVLVRKDSKVTQHLIHIKKPLLNIPNLAVHLHHSVNRRGFKPNFETNFVPVLATEISTALLDLPKNENNEKEKQKEQEIELEKEKEKEKEKIKHHPLLLKIISEELSIEPEQIIDFDISVVPSQSAQIGGYFSEFLYSDRLDNLVSTYTSITSLIDSNDKSLATEKTVRVAVCFDNEEIGSNTLRGASSTLLRSILKNITYQFVKKEQKKIRSEIFGISLRNSYLLSADSCHAVHPNYTSYHEKRHVCKINEGIIIETNYEGDTTTELISRYILKSIAKNSQISIQDAIIINETGGGSTLGPMLSTQLGITSSDIGIPSWGMHSVRETAGTTDIFNLKKLFIGFFKNYYDIFQTIQDID
ncbi:aspartyl aminopeptidase [Anaeramoeba flamelloides]|uniref:aspartyl aminopeptidase n=1 Tax=Anaeramoeba flamelloides TaxID=1746091 RepID=A0ABQ8Z585_9EUKA|nr:aspartyl aminopeptidase [Anaeramoeba flamelloides]